MNTKPQHLDPAWLRQKYEVEGLSTYDIGRIVGRDPKGVYVQLVKFGITTRPRGLNLKGEDRSHQCGPHSNLGRFGNDNFMAQPGAVNPFLGRKHSAETRAILSDKASVPKPYLRGKANGMAGRTGETNPNFKDGSSPERQRLYANAEWKALIRRIYARDGYSCVCCGSAKKGPRELHAHHKKPWAGNPALRFDESNIITLCRECHNWVHSTLNTDRDFLA